MEGVAADVRQRIHEGCRFVDLLSFLALDESFKLTPFNLMRVLSEAIGLSMIESREMVSMFDEKFYPLVPDADIEHQWRAILDGRRGRACYDPRHDGFSLHG
ncbi:hypothetical protein [Microbispora triticiradicis]|uniref:hypothetical protein n=1 Tax=Microbispora triticiradicis TaxID=2200763 RepID=UPI001058FABE|nr:hypothetical protein [Microbispora triticiradicis]